MISKPTSMIIETSTDTSTPSITSMMMRPRRRRYTKILPDYQSAQLWKATTPLYSHTDRQVQARPTPWKVSSTA